MSTDAFAGSVRPMRRDARRNQQSVIAAAREVLSELGDDATMELIATRAGVGIGTIYRCYPNKSALLTELVRSIADDLMVAAREALADDDGNALRVFLHALGQSFADHRGYADKLMAHSDENTSAELHDLMAELLAEGQRHGTIGKNVDFADVLATVAALRGVVHGAPAPSARSTDVWQRFLAFHLLGLRPA
jgi:AcrR family transcriptional regulator